MDHNRFDDLTRALAQGTSRRQALRLLGGSLAGGLLAALGVGQVAAEDTCKPNGKKCRKDAQCCSKNCVDGTCAACPAGRTLCDGECVNTDSHEEHCSGCGNKCLFEGVDPADIYCYEGFCQRG